MKTWLIIPTACLLLTATAHGGSNLVTNGDFSATNEFLLGWKYDYRDTGNSLWADNHELVSVINEDGRECVLDLRADFGRLQGAGQGTFVDSHPIPVTPGGRYKLTVTAKSGGPDCRILVEGYRWRPGVKPHAKPTLAEVRKCYRFAQVYFGPEKAGVWGGIKPGLGWVTASQTFPEDPMSKLAQEKFNQVQFLVVHIIAIGGYCAPDGWGHLYVDDVKLERIK
ncbi:MAG: hypothetical protein HYV35_06335 [Lentisphaerae bacterium]|nr:hypothetical protein [Lentisphaerota bacterium]